MAETRAVWGIDIGQAGLKAIKLRYAEASEQAIAVAFDYVPHPKILSQPDAIPEELIPQALEKFLSRNDIKGDAICISVPGQTALARFIQLPPVEASKVGDIVKYEARQQIPFALEDVIWDYQTLGGGSEESGFMLEAEVGLFAMKKEQVHQHLKPFVNAKVEVDLIQIAPLALYNFLGYDKLGMRGDVAPPNPDEYYIVLDMGADNTTLLVSNGQKIWIRNVPIGGNHFTRALTKEMKLTFAKAEHLKCNATKSPDPRAVFQALRPVFNDYVSEIQRSIGYFSSVNRDAKITKVIGCGNGFKLAGLQKFLQQNLQYEVERVDTFQGLVGDTVLNAALFQENILAFAVPYGLALQGLAVTRIHTTLLPVEIANARKIRRKKPWAAVTAATLLFGLATTAAGYANVWSSVSPERWGALDASGDSTAVGKANALTAEVSNLTGQYGAKTSKNTELIDRGTKLVSNLDTRERWAELYKAINECLPRDVGDDLDETAIEKKNRMRISSITTTKVPDTLAWFSSLTEPQRGFMSPRENKNPPSGPGYIVTLTGAHYHTGEDRNDKRELYIANTLQKNLQSWVMQREGGTPVPVGKIGISHAAILDNLTTPIPIYPEGFRNPQSIQPGMNMGQPQFGGGFRGQARPVAPDLERIAAAQGEEVVKPKMIERTAFTVQFVWVPTPVAARVEAEPEFPITSKGPQDIKPAPIGGGGQGGGFGGESSGSASDAAHGQ